MCAYEGILAQSANATVSVFGNIVVLAHALPNCFQKRMIQLLKRHTEYRLQLSVSRAPRNTPFCRGRVSLSNEMHGLFPVFGM